MEPGSKLVIHRFDSHSDCVLIRTEDECIKKEALSQIINHTMPNAFRNDESIDG